jgi:signal transduction histidine kinase
LQGQDSLRLTQEQLVAETRERTQFNIHIDLDGEQCPVDPIKQLALFRIAQEALNNARKHAGADEITVILKCSSEKTRLSIEVN